VTALQHKWRRRLEGTQLRAQFAALQVAMAAASDALDRGARATAAERALIEAANTATVELGEFLLRVARDNASTVLFDALEAVAAMVTVWADGFDDAPGANLGAARRGAANGASKGASNGAPVGAPLYDARFGAGSGVEVTPIDPRDLPAIMEAMSRPPTSAAHSDDGCEVCKILARRARAS
jgi:hypothetical protein